MPKAGTRILHYKILSEIGRGGMGEVYLALDTKLDRRVALKILPSNFSQNPDRVARFIQEAKAASSLNHPNIVTVFEIGEFEGIRFIASELIEGKSLHEKTGRELLTVDACLEIVIQIASALNAAHKLGVVHRDIKPENIMIRRDGIVKVLDFGLAKLVNEPLGQPIDNEAATKAQVATNPGTVMGTMPYMSPEQARGKEIDTRSDIWSLGVLLYEMLTGKRPFDGDTPSDTIASILKTEPPPVSDLGVVVPSELERILQRALRKSKSERYQHVGDLQIDLKEVLQELEFKALSDQPTEQLDTAFENVEITEDTAIGGPTTAGHDADGASTVKESKVGIDPIGTRILLAAGAAAISLMSIAAVYWYWISIAREDSFQNMRFDKLTSKGDSVEGLVSITPDGKYVVYVAQKDGRQSLYLTQIATSSNVGIFDLAEGEFWGVSFSPDGNYVFYTAGKDDGPGALYQLPVLGGASRKLLENVDGGITISPDGRNIAFVRDETEILISDLAGNDVTLLKRASEGNRWIDLAWKRDGTAIAASYHSMSDTNVHLSEIAVADGTETIINGPAWLRISGIDWLPDDTGILVSGRDFETELSQLWLLSYPDGEIRKITNDLSSYIGLSVSRDGEKIVSVQLERISNIWYAPNAPNPPAKKLTSDAGKDEGMSGVVWTPDGEIIYTTRERGSQDLWKVDKDGGEPRRLTEGSGANFSPAVARDGRYVVFASTRFGDVNLWRTGLDGDSPRQLTNDPGIEGAPSIAPDGKTVIYQRTDTENRSSIWKVGIAGGRAEQITTEQSARPIVSPDGKWIACEVEEKSEGKFPSIAVLPFDGGPPSKLIELPHIAGYKEFRWAPDSRSILFIQTIEGVTNIYRQSLEEDSVTKVTKFETGIIWRFDLSENGIVLAKGNQSSNVIVVENFK